MAGTTVNCCSCRSLEAGKPKFDTERYRFSGAAKASEAYCISVVNVNMAFLDCQAVIKIY
jgi:hypothetical protein